MWAQYRKTLWPTQAVICTVTICLYWFVDRTPVRAATLFLVMQLFAVVGAAWAARLRRALLARSEQLPLSYRN